MASDRSKYLCFRMVLLMTSAVATVLATGGRVACAQEASAQPPDASATASKSTGSSKSPSSDTPNEVIVTGTNIKGVKPIDQVITITRQDIDESGYATTGDVIRSLPEDFAGDQNPGTLNGSGGVNNENVTNGSSVDLFGLGSDATLTLLNGHRMASDGIFKGADISVIPLAAIQRVEVVADGSSAIYGSDAVAGVVNFILRQDYNGLEASAYYGGATEGGDDTQIYSFLGGVSNDHWHILASAEYQHETPINASERAFTSGSYGPDSLIEAQDRKTFFTSGGVNINDSISFSIDGLYSDRESGGTYGAINSFSENLQLNSPNTNLAETLKFKLPRDWSLSLVGTEAVSSTSETYQEAYGQYLFHGAVTLWNSVNSVELTANGTAATLPTGDLRAAIGGGYRAEAFKEDFPGFPADNSEVVNASRNLIYGYGEVLLPLVEASPSRLGLEELEFSASGRYEHYSDFGGTANPKVGFRYVPITGLSVRGSWGTSFEAPSFEQEYQAIEVIYEAAQPYGGKGDALFTFGGNPKLKPERSNNWTIGADFSPPHLKSLTFSLTYFIVNYKDRIVDPINGENQNTFAVDPSDAAFVISNPSSTEDQNVIASGPTFLNAVGQSYNPSSVNYIIQDTYQNAEAENDTGVTASYRESFQFGAGSLRVFANATWNHLTEQISPGEQFETLSGTVFNIPKFRARTGVSFAEYGLTGTAILNYTSSETNNLVASTQTVGSLTTVDANISYKFSDRVGIRRGLSVTLSAINLFDKAPPFVKSPDAQYGGANYDSLNASAIGRFVAFNVKKTW